MMLLDTAITLCKLCTIGEKCDFQIVNRARETDVVTTFAQRSGMTLHSDVV